MAEADRPIELRGTMADDEAALKKGKAGSLVIMGLLACALLGGLVYLMGGEDQARVYGDLGKQINGLKQSAFDQFWGCALQDEDLRDVKSNTDLIIQLGGRASHRGRAYGVHLRDSCLPELEPVGPALETLIEPPDLEAPVQRLHDASNKLRSATSELIVYLDDPELEYDEAAAKPHLQAMARAWYEFKKAHGEINQIIKQKLE